MKVMIVKDLMTGDVSPVVMFDSFTGREKEGKHKHWEGFSKPCRQGSQQMMTTRRVKCSSHYISLN